jgi:hypothetical protein
MSLAIDDDRPGSPLRKMVAAIPLTTSIDPWRAMQIPARPAGAGPVSEARLLKLTWATGRFP